MFTLNGKSLYKVCKLTLLLGVFLSVISCAAETKKKSSPAENSPLFPIYVNDQVSLLPYFEEVDEIESVDYKEQLSRQWMVSLNLKSSVGELHRTVANCEELFVAKSIALEPVKAFEFSVYRQLVNQCHAVQVVSEIEEAKVSFFNGLKLDSAILNWLPIDLAFIISGEELRRIENDEQLKSLSDYEKVLTVEAESVWKATFHTSSYELVVTILARGDINKDGIEDILLGVDGFVKGGTYSSSRLFVLSRNDKETMYEIIENVF